MNNPCNELTTVKTNATITLLEETTPNNQGIPRIGQMTVTFQSIPLIFGLLFLLEENCAADILESTITLITILTPTMQRTGPAKAQMRFF